MLKEGIEVLLLTDRVDEWMLTFLNEFEGKPLVSVAKGDLDLGELADAAEKEARERVAGEFKDLVARVKTALGERASDVRVTLRLTDSPACVVVERDAMSQHLQRLLKGAGRMLVRLSRLRAAARAQGRDAGAGTGEGRAPARARGGRIARADRVKFAPATMDIVR